MKRPSRDVNRVKAEVRSLGITCSATFAWWSSEELRAFCDVTGTFLRDKTFRIELPRFEPQSTDYRPCSRPPTWPPSTLARWYEYGVYLNFTCCRSLSLPTMIAPRAFAAPARQCLRKACVQPTRAPTFAQVRFQ